MNDDESVEVFDIADCILSVEKSGNVKLKCEGNVDSINISKEEMETLKGISDIATED